MAAQVSEWWRNGRVGAEEMTALVELLDANGAPFRSSDPETSVPLHCTGASVQVDRGRSVWATATIQLLFPWDARQELLDLLPTNPMAPLAPTSGCTFRLSCGFKRPDTGELETVYVGRFDIEDTATSETAAGIVIDVDGQDLSGRIDVDDIGWPIDIPWGWRTIDIAKWLVSTTIPGLGFVEDPTWETSARVILSEQANRLTEVNNALRSIGFEGFVDPSGTFMRLRRIPTTADTPQWTFDPDQVNFVHEVGQQQSRSRVYNGVFFKGENPNSTDPPVRAISWITDINDPTHYIIGPPIQTIIGPRPIFFTTQYVRTQEQAQAASDGELRRIRGLLQRVTMTTTVNPAIQAGDVIYVARETIGVIGRYVVQSLSFDLTSDLMRLTCEERRV